LTQKTRRRAGGGKWVYFFAAFARAYFAAWRHLFEQYRARASEAVNPRPQWAQA